MYENSTHNNCDNCYREYNTVQPVEPVGVVQIFVVDVPCKVNDINTNPNQTYEKHDWKCKYHGPQIIPKKFHVGKEEQGATKQKDTCSCYFNKDDCFVAEDSLFWFQSFLDVGFNFPHVLYGSGYILFCQTSLRGVYGVAISRFRHCLLLYFKKSGMKFVNYCR